MMRRNGFTLIEVMITVAIVAILASIAYPSYTQYVARGNRAEGHAAVMRIANLQEQFYLDHRSYTDDMSQLGLGADPFMTDHGHYSVDTAISSDGDSFTITATAKGSQASRDSDCISLSLTDAGVKGPKKECWQ